MPKKKNWIAAVLASGLLLTGIVPASFGDTEEEASAATQASDDQQPAKPASKPPLDGAKVYAWNCGSCHSERWPKERTDAEWEVIATHMRVRANMTANQTEAVLRYLKENN